MCDTIFGKEFKLRVADPKGEGVRGGARRTVVHCRSNSATHLPLIVILGLLLPMLP